MKTEINEFLNEKRSEGRAKSTIYEYGLYLTAFDNFTSDKPLSEVSNADIVNWIASIKATRQKEGKPLADSSILARWRSIKIFLNWCVASEKLDFTPLRMKAPKIKRERSRLASLDDVQKLLAFPSANWLDDRNKCLVHLLLDSGLRIGEALNLRRSDIDWENRLLDVGSAKDNEPRYAPFTQACAERIKAYLDERPQADDPALEPWVFVGSYNASHGNPIVAGPFTTVGARLMLRKFCKKVGIDYVNPHSLRHLFATKALNDGMRVEVISKILGHFDVTITLKIYAKLLTKTITREYNEHWKC